MKKFFRIAVIGASALLAAFATACSCTANCGVTEAEPQYYVTLDATDVSLMALERYELTAVVRDADLNEADAEVVWASADENVAKVTGGVIFATGAGTTEVTAAVGNGQPAKCIVTVRDDGIIPELRVNREQLTIAEGGKFTLVSRVLFNGEDRTEADTAFTYISSQESVAAVSADGVITGVSAGSAKITVWALWHGIGGPDRVGDAGAIAGLSLTIEVTVVEI